MTQSVELEPLFTDVPSEPVAAPAKGGLSALSEWVSQEALALRDFLNTRTIVLLLYGWTCVRLCAPDALHLTWDFSTMEIIFGVIFPLTYAIGQSFGRREKVLDILAQMKVASVSLAHLYRDHDQGEGSVPGVGGPLSRNAALVLTSLAENIKLYVEHKATTPHEEDGPSTAYFHRVLICFSTLSRLNERLLFKQNMANFGHTRANEYLRIVMLGFEQIRSIKKYESSPVRLTKLVSLMVHLTPMLLSPYWRHYCPDYDKGKGISPKRICVPAYLCCTVFCVIVSTMASVAAEIGDPWDGVGQDDIHIALREEVAQSLRAAPLPLDAHGNVEFPWPLSAAEHLALRVPAAASQ